MLTSDALLAQTTPVPYFEARLKHVALSQIVASEGRAHEFDLQFAPLHEHIRERWQDIAAAWIAGQPLPPVQLIQVDERYIVRDGHHRISVAYAVGATTIEAVIEQQFVTNLHQ